MNSYCFSVRDTRGQKLVEGTIHAENLDDAANRVASFKEFDVDVTLTGRPFFVRNDQEVYLHLSILPEYTQKGQAALVEHRKVVAERRAAEEKQAEIDRQTEEEILDAARTMGLDAAKELLNQKKLEG